MNLLTRSIIWFALVVLLAGRTASAAPNRPPAPVRDPHQPGYVFATELPNGSVPAPTADGNFILGPTHPAAPELSDPTNVLLGTVREFTLRSEDSHFYPGIAREPKTFGTPDPADPTRLLVPTSHPAPYTRRVAFYLPPGADTHGELPFIVGADGPDRLLFQAVDALVAAHRLPPMAAISIGNGGGDAQGSERGLEYDTLSGRYAEFVEAEILPEVEHRGGVRLTRNPEGRATIGTSSGAACALTMAWYHPEWYRRVLSYSGTFVNQQWPHNPATPHGAWGYHERIISESPVRPLRLWLEVGDRDLLNPNIMRDNMHDWVLANERMAQVLATKGYHYQFLFARNAGHGDRKVKRQTLPEALEWLWHDYPRR